MFVQELSRWFTMLSIDVLMLQENGAKKVSVT
jgi:hypothetical protein